MNKGKVYKDIRSFLYKYTHEAALIYPEPSDYIDLAKDMEFSKTSLRLDFPEGMYSRGNGMTRVIYDSGRPSGQELSYEYTVSMGGKVEVVYSLNEGVQLSEDEKEIYQWVTDQIFLVYGKQQVVDALNLVSKIRREEQK
jgi:hypothetical protein